MRRGKEEEEVNLFKLVVGGSNVLGLAPNLVSPFLYFEYFNLVT
jgi:hypothetical protein